MATDQNPYLAFEPGQLITAEDQNSVQLKIKNDIRATVDKAIGEIKVVKQAENADKLNDKNLEQLIKEITDRVLQEVQKRSGYLNVFRRLPWNGPTRDAYDDSSIIKHNLGTFPLVDVYRLDYFDAIVAEDGDKFQAQLLFYLYHGSEKRIRLAGASGKSAVSVEIERTDAPIFKIRFKEMLTLLKVEYAEDAQLSDVEDAFWSKFFNDPNDNFDDDQYGHSLWFDKCCGDERTVDNLGADFDNIWLKMMPRKTLNYVPVLGNETAEPDVPNSVRVMQVDRNTVALKQIEEPKKPPTIPATIPFAERTPSVDRNELPVMVILKV